MGNIPIKEATPPTMRADTILWWNTEITTGMNNETSICGITTNIFKTPAESTLISRQEEEVGRESRKNSREKKKRRQTHIEAAFARSYPLPYDCEGQNHRHSPWYSTCHDYTHRA